MLVVGGGDIYRQTIGRADRLEITHVDADVAGDTRFPDIDPAVWQVADRQDADGYAFVSYLRREPIRDLRRAVGVDGAGAARRRVPVLHRPGRRRRAGGPDTRW